MAKPNDVSFLLSWVARIVAHGTSFFQWMHVQRKLANCAETDWSTRATEMKPKGLMLTMRWALVAYASDERMPRMLRNRMLPALECSWRLRSSEVIDRSVVARAW